MTNKTNIYFDTEFNRTQEKFINPVCAALGWYDDPSKPTMSSFSFWTHKDDMDDRRNDFIAWMNEPSVINECRFVSFSVEAEASYLLSLGIDPTKYEWVDLYLEWRQLLNHCADYMYGRHYVDGKSVYINPPQYDENGKQVQDDDWEFDDGDDITSGKSHVSKVSGLISCCYKLTGIKLDSVHKNQMRDLIIKGGPFSAQDRTDILHYCENDIRYLKDILFKIMEGLKTKADIDEETFYKNAAIKGRWACDLAKIKSQGIPLNMDRVRLISENIKPITDMMIQDLNDTSYPFFIWNKREERWSENQDKFETFLIKNDVYEDWPKSEKTGRAKKDKNTLSDNEHIREILEYRRVKESLGQLKTLDPKNVDGFYNFVGSDNRQRPYFGPYGTQTGRNAAQAKSFIFACSAWMRSIIQAPPGYAITGADYANQEFLIAALESGDKAMEAAYDTGDPYMAFAIQVGMCPIGANKNSHPAERDLVKSLILGLQYGLGLKKLSIKLTRDTGRLVTEDDAKYYRDLHKEQYHVYWDWQESKIGNKWKHIDGEYQLKQLLSARDGWLLLGDNPNLLSVGNFPIQSAGAVVLRKAIKLLHDSGVKVVAPLHDAVYIEHEIEETQLQQTILVDCMTEAFRHYYGRDIRIECETHEHGKEWIEKKGKKLYWLLAPYFMPDLQFLME